MHERLGLEARPPEIGHTSLYALERAFYSLDYYSWPCTP